MWHQATHTAFLGVFSHLSTIGKCRVSTQDSLEAGELVLHGGAAAAGGDGVWVC